MDQRPIYVTREGGGDWYRVPSAAHAMMGLEHGLFAAVSMPVNDDYVVYDAVLADAGRFPFRKAVTCPIDAPMLSFASEPAQGKAA